MMAKVASVRVRLCLVTLSALAACSGPKSGAAEAGQSGSDAAHLNLGGQLIYTLDWDRRGIQTDETEGRWTATNELGLEFELTQAYAVTYSLELVPCVWPPEEDAGLGDLARRLWEFLGPRQAYAGHDGEAANPTRIASSRAEPIHEPQAYVSPIVSSQSTSYCQLHYLVARAHGGTEQLPEAPDMLGRSAYLSGRWRAPGGDWTSFQWSTDLPWGELLQLHFDDEESSEVARGDPTRVVITRPLAGLLTGVDPRQMGAQVLANTVIKQMVLGTRVRVETATGVWTSPP